MNTISETPCTRKKSGARSAVSRSETIEKESALPFPTDWQAIKWRQAEKYVEKLQQRIFRAEKMNDKRKVRDLQRMLMKSKSALLVSIRRVTQINKGKRTAGVDGFKALTAPERLESYRQMVNMDVSKHNPKPL